MAHHGLIIALGLGKKKGGGEPPPSRYKKLAAPPDEAETPNEDPMEETSEASPISQPGGMDDSAGGMGVGPADVDYSDNDLCETCANMGQDGNCIKYGFPVQPNGHCEAGYEPKEGAAPLGGGGVGESLGGEAGVPVQ